MKIGDKMRHTLMGCIVTILEIKSTNEVKCRVECNEDKPEVWYLKNELENI